MYLTILKSMIEYKEGYELKEDEYLLKIVRNVWNDGSGKGFMTKFNKDGTVPVSFKNWPVRRYFGNSPADWDHPVYIHKEEFAEGWRIMSWRFGQSQNWASLVHPKGFTVEIYLTQLLEIVKSHTVIKGEIQGEFMWQDHKLISKND